MNALLILSALLYVATALKEDAGNERNSATCMFVMNCVRIVAFFCSDF